MCRAGDVNGQRSTLVTFKDNDTGGGGPVRVPRLCPELVVLLWRKVYQK